MANPTLSEYKNPAINPALMPNSRRVEIYSDPEQYNEERIKLTEEMLDNVLNIF